ncbi:MAG: hypothetical protein QOI70_1790 [Microbacteriaceae bacterium]|jgi:hypothetical protein|nr:hypothetical protein [Microbacteriaceae bacterium]
MDWFAAEDYDLARQVIQRGIGATYLIAFLSTAAQFRVLLGERGLLPAPDFIAATSWRTAPTLFRWRYSDRLLLVVAWTGAVLAASAILGLPQLGPPWVPLLVYLVLWALYLSIVNVGQTFYGFGWESLLLEAGFVVAFLGSDATAPPIAILLFLRWLVFRLEFGAGLIKLRGDTAWRDLTAMFYHHETQPMPGPLSWWAHHLPRWFHRLEVVGNHFAQLVIPFLLFAPQPVASIAGIVIVLTQLWLVVTGNFAWLNAITIVLAFSAIGDSVVHAIIPAVPADLGVPQSAPLWFTILVVVVIALLVVLSYWPARNLLARRQLMNASFNPLHLVNAYGAFGTITRQRYEIVIEGTDVEEPDESTTWLEYEFKGKPGDVKRMPRQFAPYHLRLDWLMWFLPLGMRRERWFIVLLMRLLTADAATLKLLRLDPFDGRRPRWLRAQLYVYRYSTFAERRETGAWWVREPSGSFVPPVTLSTG